MKNQSTELRKPMLSLIFIMIVVTACSAFAVVWMQQQITRTAQSSQVMERQLAETVRKLRYLDERIATVHQPVVLQGKVSSVLRPSMENQVVWVREKSAPDGRVYAAAQPYEASMNLALADIQPIR
jgi:spore maturation protein CgeB